MTVFCDRELRALRAAIGHAAAERHITPACARAMRAELDKFACVGDVVVDIADCEQFDPADPLYRPARLLRDIWELGGELVPWTQSLASHAASPCPLTLAAVRASRVLLNDDLAEGWELTLERILFWTGGEPGSEQWVSALADAAGLVTG